jgi:hypothetical protein
VCFLIDVYLDLGDLRGAFARFALLDDRRNRLHRRDSDGSTPLGRTQGRFKRSCTSQFLLRVPMQIVNPSRQGGSDAMEPAKLA